MADFYEEMAAFTRDILSPTSAGGLGQGKIELARTVTIPGPNPWDEPEIRQVVDEIKGAVRGVDARLVGVEIGGIVIKASDRVATTEPPPVAYTVGDILSIDGKPVHIIAVEKIPAAGITSAVKFIIRGG